MHITDEKAIRAEIRAALLREIDSSNLIRRAIAQAKAGRPALLRMLLRYTRP